MYIDTSGVRDEKNTIEVTSGKTLNISVDDNFTAVFIPYTYFDTMINLSRLTESLLKYVTLLYAEDKDARVPQMKRLFGDNKEVLKFLESNGADEIAESLRKAELIRAFNEMVLFVYEISAPFVSEKKSERDRYFKALAKRAEKDANFITDIVLKLLEFWEGEKKKLFETIKTRIEANTLNALFLPHFKTRASVMTTLNTLLTEGLSNTSTSTEHNQNTNERFLMR